MGTVLSGQVPKPLSSPTWPSSSSSPLSNLGHALPAPHLRGTMGKKEGEPVSSLRRRSGARHLGTKGPMSVAKMQRGAGGFPVAWILLPVPARHASRRGCVPPGASLGPAWPLGEGTHVASLYLRCSLWVWARSLGNRVLCAGGRLARPPPREPALLSRVMTCPHDQGCRGQQAAKPTSMNHLSLV